MVNGDALNEAAPEFDVIISIVSHAQGALVKDLLDDLMQYERGRRFAVVLTCNLPERLPFETGVFPYTVHTIENSRPKGFAANHNAAFRSCVARGMVAKVFCVVNPDVRLAAPTLARLHEQLNKYGLGLIAPVVKNKGLAIEDSARRIPTPLRIMQKVLRRKRKADYEISTAKVIYPEWIAGMFMAVRWELYSQIGGFDERYFLYYEDVDLCCRLRLAGHRLGVDGGIYIVHDARRSSHKKLKYLRWHIISMIRFFLSPTFFRCRLISKAREAH